MYYSFIPAGNTQGTVIVNKDIEELKKEVRNSEIKFLVDENQELRNTISSMKSLLKVRIMRNILPEYDDVTAIANNDAIEPSMLEDMLFIRKKGSVYKLNKQEIKNIINEQNNSQSKR